MASRDFSNHPPPIMVKVVFICLNLNHGRIKEILSFSWNNEPNSIFIQKILHVTHKEVDHWLHKKWIF